MIKLIATDMDGTLLNSSREIDREFYEVLDKLEEKNIIMAFASGRNLEALTKLVPDSMQERIMFISNNGNNIIYKGEQIHSSTISMEDVEIIDKTIDNMKGIDRVLCMDNNTVYTSSFKNWCIGRLKGYKQTVFKKDFKSIKGRPEKYTLFTAEENQENILNLLEPLKDRLSIVPSGKVTIDISAKGINKGTAIEMIQSKYGISKEETMVFGDYLNDLEMMDKAYYSHAMENAHPELKKKARFIAGHHNKKGVINAILKEINKNN